MIIIFGLLGMSDKEATEVQDRMRDMIKSLHLADKSSIPSDYTTILDDALQINTKKLSYHVCGYNDTLALMLIEYERAKRRDIKPEIISGHDSEDGWECNQSDVSLVDWDEY
jgi:hypothetical protein